MLKDVTVGQVHRIAGLAQAARAQRDDLLGHVPERDLGGTIPARGEHNPTAALGFEPLPAEAAELIALHEAIAAMSPAARRELYTLAQIGQGQLAVAEWQGGLSEAERIGDETIAASLIDDADLHDHLAKGLYEAKPAP